MIGLRSSKNVLNNTSEHAGMQRGDSHIMTGSSPSLRSRTLPVLNTWYVVLTHMHMRASRRSLSHCSRCHEHVSGFHCKLVVLLLGHMNLTAAGSCLRVSAYHHTEPILVSLPLFQ